MGKIDVLLSCLDIHFYCEAGCWEEDVLLVWREFAMVANLVFEVFVTQAEDMMNLHVWIRNNVIFLRIFCLFELSGSEDLPFILICCPCSFCHWYFRPLIIYLIINLLPNFTTFNLLLWINLLLLQFIILLCQRRIIPPYQYRFLFSSNTHNILYLIRFLFMGEFDSSYSVRMSLVFVINYVVECGVVEQL